MASPHRSPTRHVTFDTQEPVLDAIPLSVVSYSGRPTSTNNHAPSSQTREPMGNLQGSFSAAVVLSGSAAIGKNGPIVGLVDMGESGDCYFFRVTLPGVRRDTDDFTCKIESNGKVKIEGITTTGEKTVYKNHHKFEMLSANLCPPGHFSISFKLPGPVNQYQFSGNLGADGILEGVIKKS
ncbi:hypothetical protein RHSIM_Rhsim07G0181800 [Rhododendron simsii]|uniref:SHSP domain-containing protein n=1 Tax=Rhododendron simsii TaxID=118357 RepID=A0A834GNC5_RHOSS|nr:hypothetical protein RHSIM_Rhsim07G0181800 [Rhododendron simsii]